MLTVYDYIAQNDPMTAKMICEHFGYSVSDPSIMGDNLKTLVNEEGEEAIRVIMDNHPDKDFILEYFGEKKKKKKEGCGCKKKALDSSYHNASGRSADSTIVATNTNTIIFASALFLAVAIIFKNN